MSPAPEHPSGGGSERGTSRLETSARRLPRQLWTPAGSAFLVVSLVALAAGLLPEWIIHRDAARTLSAPPALAALLAAQAGFILLFCPLVLARRAERGALALTPVGLLVVQEIGEFATWVVASIPLYVVAAWFADAGWADVLRGVLYLSAVGLGALGVASWTLSGESWRAAGLLLCLLAVLGLPAGAYLLAEVPARPVAVGGLLRAGPVTAAFLAGISVEHAGPPAGELSAGVPWPGWLPEPLWSWALWPGFGGAVVLLRLLASAPHRQHAER